MAKNSVRRAPPATHDDLTKKPAGRRLLPSHGPYPARASQSIGSAAMPAIKAAGGWFYRASVVRSRPEGKITRALIKLIELIG
jgi:hypothetical protein